jgi:hypothetical protein
LFAASVIATATINNIDDLQMKTALITGYTEDAHPDGYFGPNFTEGNVYLFTY